MKIIFVCIVGMIMDFGTAMATQRNVPSTYSTIAAAITAASTSNHDTVMIAGGTYNEATVAVTKSNLTLIGAGISTVISNGITVSAGSVVLESLRVAHTSSNGISASGVSNLSLVNITSDSNSTSGAQLTNITGTSVITNFSATGNKDHGLSIRGNSSNITISGGTFNNNGTTRGSDGTGGGIDVFASGGTIISNISILGPLAASNNTTAGIWFDTDSNTDTIKTVTVGASGTITLTNNGGAGVIILGNVENATITGNFTIGSATAAGVLIVGTDFAGDSSPKNTIVKKCTFNSGYSPSYPAISMSAGVYPYTSVNPATADSDTFVGASDSAAIENLIYDYDDDPGDHLGLVTVTHYNPTLPVEMTSFTASAQGRQIELRWSTATEINNYGFEVERTSSLALPLKGEGLGGGQWNTVAFLNGSGTSNVKHLYSYTDAVPSAGKFQYRLKQIDHDGNFAYSPTVEVNATLTPEDYTLSQNFPNPFNPSTKIQFALANTQFAQLKVFNSAGEEVKTLFSGVGEAGVVNEVQFDGKDFASGVYFYSLTASGRHDVRKMLLLK